MQLTSLDIITRRTLFNKGLPLHFYIRFLSYSAECLRELTMDTLQITNTVKLNLNSYYAVDLPCDFVQSVLIGIERGQFVQPVTQREGINNLNNLDTQGNPIPYKNNALPVQTDGFFFPGYWLYPAIDDLGENLGKMYGINTGLVSTSYKIIPGRNQIQFSEDFPSASIVLEYLPNGENVDNATKVDTRAIQTIQSYIDWQWKIHSRKSTPYEIESAKKIYGNDWRKLRSRISSVTLQDIRQSLLKSYQSSIKI